MQRRKRLFLLLLAFVALGVVALIVGRPREPSYKGKLLSDWLCGVRTPTGPSKENILAVRHIGTNAVPFLLKWIQYQPRPWSHKLWAAFTPLHRRFPVRLLNSWPGRAQDALVGFSLLGPQARGAIPDLTPLLNSTNQRLQRMATHALCAIGKDAVPTWLDVLTNRPAHQNFPRDNLSSVWTELGAHASSSVPVLIEHLNDEDTELAQRSMQLLGTIAFGGHETPAVLPALCAALESTNADVRCNVIITLSNFGDRARPAVPLLVKALSDSEPLVRKAATNSLEEIAPEALENTSDRHQPAARNTPDAPKAAHLTFK